jgi:carbon-monoxide dehydrogenase medium subunit
MMPLRRFTIHQPKSVTEASQMLAEFGEKGRLYAGGTELLLAMKHDLLRYDHLIDAKTIPGLDKIQLTDSTLSIGALATHRSIENSSLVRGKLVVMAEMARNVANVRVRATGTLGGNLCFAEPHSDPSTLLVALEAQVRVQGTRGQRALNVDDFISGAYETTLRPDELLIGIDVPVLSPTQRAAYLKFQIHERPTLGLALVLDLEEGGAVVKRARAVVGSVSPTPCRSEKADAMLTGSGDQLEKQLAAAAQALADAADPVDDLEGSAEYKRHLIGVILKRALTQALTDR